MKTIHTLVQDIYKLMMSKRVPSDVDAEQAIEEFGENIKKLMRKEFVNREYGKAGLRLSSSGKGLRYLWNTVHRAPRERIMPHTLIKFMYGHLIEELLLCLTKLSGHKVEDEQKVCTVAGVKGHMDCRIDGTMVDVKSTSTYGFKKFRDGSLAMDDPFGYVAQLKAYAHSEGDTKIAWLAMDKQNGHLEVLQYDMEDTQAPVHEHINYDIEERIEEIKKVCGQDEAPSHCHKLVPDGASGNMKLSMGCSYCQFKQSCWPGLRAFKYSTGPRFLGVVENEPKVPEIPLQEIS